MFATHLSMVGEQLVVVHSFSSPFDYAFYSSSSGLLHIRMMIHLQLDADFGNKAAVSAAKIEVCPNTEHF